MSNINREPANNFSPAVIFLLRGAKKRRTIAMSKAKMIQGEQGIVPRLTAIK